MLSLERVLSSYNSYNVHSRIVAYVCLIKSSLSLSCSFQRTVIVQTLHNWSLLSVNSNQVYSQGQIELINFWSSLYQYFFVGHIANQTFFIALLFHLRYSAKSFVVNKILSKKKKKGNLACLHIYAKYRRSHKNWAIYDRNS